MDGEQVPRIGVVSDSSLHLFEIQSVLRDSGYAVALACDPDGFSDTALQHAAADAWVLSLSEQADSGAILSLLLDHVEVPVLMDDTAWEQGAAQNLAGWSLRLTAKLKQLPLNPVVSSGNICTSANPILERARTRSRQSEVARNVWILGASLGGPEAMAEFLQALPGDLPVCFVYAQHIDTNFSAFLAEVMSRNTDLRSGVLGDGSVLNHGELGIVPVETELRFRPMGRVEDTHREWPGPFAPAIDQVISDIAAVYRDCCGAIIFSGMGQDGAGSCELLSRAGGTVWAQHPETCICSSMPDAAIQTGHVEYQASPAQLAQALTQRYSHQSYRQDLA